MRLPPRDDTTLWGLGLSGGADSTALLLRCAEAGFPVRPLHFNHAFPDENGDEAEDFCRALCRRLGLPLLAARCPETRPPRETKEVFARRHRMVFFADAARRLGLGGILLAHQADDRAENLILRLARGSGLGGLSSFGIEGTLPGVPGVRLWRPLLDETHAAQVAWLQAHGESWVEDASNADTSIPRNAIRHLLLPRLPHFTAGANATADLLAEEDAFLETLAENAVETRTERALALHPGTPPVLCRRALRRWLPGLTRTWLERLCALPEGQIVQTPGAVRVEKTRPGAWRRLAD